MFIKGVNLMMKAMCFLVLACLVSCCALKVSSGTPMNVEKPAQLCDFENNVILQNQKDKEVHHTLPAINLIRIEGG